MCIQKIYFDGLFFLSLSLLILSTRSPTLLYIHKEISLLLLNLYFFIIFIINYKEKERELAETRKLA